MFRFKLYSLEGLELGKLSCKGGLLKKHSSSFVKELLQMAMDGKTTRRRRFSLFLLFLFFIREAQPTSFTFSNHCNHTVWAGTLSGATSPALSETGFKLTSGSSTTLSALPGWSGRFWGRTLCSTDSTGKFSCTTADCATGTIPCNGAGAIPPATLAEITLSNNGGQDYYDISLVDGFNLPISLLPAGGRGDCKPASCAWDMNTICPSEMQVTSETSGAVIACKSACNAFGDAKYCCTGAYASPSSCKPSNYSKLFKDACPDAYSYAFDDPSSTFTCIGATTYVVTFCP